MTTTGLNQAQERAVTHPGAPLLVLAGAGSGKTRVLTHRIVHLVRHAGIDPAQILAVTFTNKAAREMEERVARSLALQDRSRWPLIVTFHSLGLRILKEHHRAMDLPARFAVYDWSDQKSLARRVLSDTQQKLPVGTSPDSLAYFVADQKALRRAPAAALSAAGSFRTRKLAGLYAEYQDGLRGAGAVDFEDLLFEPLRLFESHPEVLEAVRRRFQAVLVDEYQDTNENQYLLVKNLAQEHRHLTVVGDDDQSIYGWRGADARNLRRFLDDFPESDQVALEVNYRSTGLILEAANAVLAQIPDRMEKRLRPAGDRGEPLRLFEASDELAEANRVVTDLQARRQDRGLSWGDFGVLYRTNKQAEPFEEALSRAGIPYKVVGGQKFFERKEVKDVLAYLRVLSNPRDELALRRIWNTPARGLGARAQQRLLEAAATSRGGLFDHLCRPQQAGLEGKARAGATALASSLNQARARLNRDEAFPAVIRDLLDQIDYARELARLYPDQDTADKKASVLERLLEAMERFQVGEGRTSLEDFLGRMALLDERDRTKEDDEGRPQVTLMTIHAAKGLEFPHVYLVGMEDGLFPSGRSVEESGEAALNEEKRLFYVAITRAQRTLTLSWCKQRGVTTQNVRRQDPSPFLSFIARELLDELPAEDGTAARMERGKSRVADLLASLRAR